METIDRTQELYEKIRNNPKGNFKLVSDIDGSNYDSSEAVARRFSGVLDGGGYTIKNLETSLNAGLFTINAGRISNLIIENCYIGAQKVNSGLISRNNGVIENVVVSNSKIDSDSNCSYVGILVGQNLDGGVIRNCEVINSEVCLGYRSGSIAGKNENGKIESCKVVDSIVTGDVYAGLLVGSMLSSSEITNCSIKNSTLRNASFCGFLAGRCFSSLDDIDDVRIQNCCFEGENNCFSTFIAYACDGESIGSPETISDSLIIWKSEELGLCQKNLSEEPE